MGGFLRGVGDSLADRLGTVLAFALPIGMVWLLSSCSVDSGYDDGNMPDPQGRYDDAAEIEHDRQQRDRQDDRRHRSEYELGPGQWSCGWDVTLNYDWHDDVLCTNGVDRRRPYLLPGDSFVTEQEILRAAAEYEARLNGSR